jgi:hypothetical protein
MRSRSSLLILVGALLVAWLLLSSIHFIQPTQASQQSGQKHQQIGSGGGGGSIGSITAPLFQLPKISLPSIKFPGFNFSLPRISSTSVNESSGGGGNGFGTGNGNGNGSGPGSGSGVGSGSGGGYGNGGGSGSDGNSGGGGSSSTPPSTGQSQNSGPSSQTVTSQTTQNNHVVLSLPYDLLLAIIILIIIFAGAIGFVSRRGRTSLSGKKDSKSSAIQQLLQLSPVVSELAVSPVITELIPGEMVVPFQGWGVQAGFVRPEIKPDLPLIWSLDEPMKVQVPEGATLSLEGGHLQKQSPTSYSVRFSLTCNSIVGTMQGTSETKYIRAVHYGEDVVKHFRLNFFRISDVELSTLTPRELAEVLAQKYSETISDRAQLFQLIRIFERTFYGKKEISRADYEDFLVSLSSSTTNPKVIICGKPASAAS